MPNPKDYMNDAQTTYQNGYNVIKHKQYHKNYIDKIKEFITKCSFKIHDLEPLFYHKLVSFTFLLVLVSNNNHNQINQ